MAYVYSTEEFEEIKQKYASGTSLEVLAEEYSKSVASVRMKLVKAGVYQKITPAKTSKSIDGWREAIVPTVPTAKPASSSSGRMSKPKLAELGKQIDILVRDYGKAPF